MLPARDHKHNGTPAVAETLKKVTPVARRTPPAADPQRQAFRVLQTSHAPAQLSLFLRPANAR